MQQTIIICDGGESGSSNQCSKTAVVRVRTLAQAGSFIETARGYDACAGHIGEVVQLAWEERTEAVVKLRAKEPANKTPRSWEFTRIQVIEIAKEEDD